MLVVKVELHSANTGQITEIANMVIYNDGTGDHNVGNYVAKVFRKGQSYYNKNKPIKQAEVKDYRRTALHVWNLVSRALVNLGYK